MFRISEVATPEGAPETRIEGSLVGGWVEEVGRLCDDRLARGGLRLELSGVSFLDRRAATLLRDLERRGAVVVGGSALVRRQLEEVASC